MRTKKNFRFKLHFHTILMYFLQFQIISMKIEIEEL